MSKINRNMERMCCDVNKKMDKMATDIEKITKDFEYFVQENR